MNYWSFLLATLGTYIDLTGFHAEILTTNQHPMLFVSFYCNGFMHQWSIKMVSVCEYIYVCVYRVVIKGPTSRSARARILTM